MRRNEGITVIAIYYVLVALVALAVACVLGIATFATFANATDGGAAFGGAIVGVLALAFLVVVAAAAIAAWGLLATKEWGRWVAIALGVIQLIAFPIFTIIGGLIIYYLLREDVKSEFTAGGTTRLPTAGPSSGGKYTLPTPPAPIGGFAGWEKPSDQPARSVDEDSPVRTEVPLAPASAFPTTVEPVMPPGAAENPPEVPTTTEEADRGKPPADSDLPPLP